jgi:hypothetical protein
MFCLGIRLRFSLQIGCSMKVESRFFVIEGNARFNDHSARNQTAAADSGLIFDPASARVCVLKFLHRLPPSIARRSGRGEGTAKENLHISAPTASGFSPRSRDGREIYRWFKTDADLKGER